MNKTMQLTLNVDLLVCSCCGRVEGEDDVKVEACINPYMADVHNEEVPDVLCEYCYDEACKDI